MLLIIKYHVSCIFGSPDPIFFPYGLTCPHRGFAVRGGFQERTPRERQGCAVYVVCITITVKAKL
jgi:hypothetical protein